MRTGNESTPGPALEDGIFSYKEKASIAAELLQGKWTIEILCSMRERPIRLSELKRWIPLASKKALTARLRSLERAQIVQRQDLSSSVLHVEYALTDAMRVPLLTLLDKLADWGTFYASTMKQTRPEVPSDAPIEDLTAKPAANARK